MSDPWLLRLAIGAYNITSLVGKDAELRWEVGRSFLDIVSLTSPQSAGQGLEFVPIRSCPRWEAAGRGGYSTPIHYPVELQVRVPSLLGVLESVPTVMNCSRDLLKISVKMGPGDQCRRWHTIWTWCLPGLLSREELALSSGGRKCMDRWISNK